MNTLQSCLNWGKTAAAVAAVAGVMLLGAAPQARADDDHEKCQHRIEKAESRLNQAIRHHGERSEQAEERRRDLNAERDRCWNQYHGWWDGRSHQWREQRDWDHDRDDRDRDDHDHR